MVLAILALPLLVVSAAANPFHKYPYVFLLDIGNEELEKTNTEQIRLSSPGGSVALRYPAIGNGDDIAHVRVSGIDFGTDLKANVIEGGPGYKYVVIVLMGNPGVAYDAVITIQTVPPVVTNNIQINRNYVEEDVPKSDQLSENDPNNSAEDLKDYEDMESSEVAVNKNNMEETQGSSNVYSYAQNEALSGYGIENDDEDKDSKDNDENEENDDTSNDNSDQRENVAIEDYGPRDDEIVQSTRRRYTDDNSQFDNNPIIVDQNLYNKYIALKDHLYDGSEVYSQDSIQQSDSDYNIDQNYDERQIEYNDYDESDFGKFRDANNNFIDTDESSAVEQ